MNALLVAWGDAEMPGDVLFGDKPVSLLEHVNDIRSSRYVVFCVRFLNGPEKCYLFDTKLSDC